MTDPRQLWQPNTSFWNIRQILSAFENKNYDEWYLRYLLIIKYYANLYQIEGDARIKKLAHHLIRVAIEYGRVGLIKIKDKFYICQIIKAEYDATGELINVQAIRYIPNYSYHQEEKTFNVPVENVVILQFNYLNLPLVYFWKEIINNVITLKTAALTGSITSMKKFQRVVYHNDSLVSQVENESFLDPKSPYITTIDNLYGYYENRGVSEDERISKASLGGNDLVELKSSLDVNQMWDALQRYIDFEYLQQGVRINTNKKKERNVAGEVRAETSIFDIHEQDFLFYLEKFKDEVKEKFQVNIEINDLIKNLDEQDKLLMWGGKTENGNQANKDSKKE